MTEKCIDEIVQEKPVLDEQTQKSRLRCFLVTHWNPSIVSKQIDEIKLQTAFVCWQFEKCPETQKLHAHIFVMYKNAKKYKEVQAHFPWETPSWVLPAKNIQDSIRYCTTDPFITKKGQLKQKGRYEGPWEIGVRPKGQGFRSDWAEMREVCKKRKRDVLEECPEIIFKYEKAYQVIQNITNSQKSRLLEPSIHKLEMTQAESISHLEKDLKIDPYDIYIVNRTTANRMKPWEGYESQPVLLVDKDCAGLIPRTRQPLDIHYGHIYPCWDKIYFFYLV